MVECSEFSGNQVSDKHKPMQDELRERLSKQSTARTEETPSVRSARHSSVAANIRQRPQALKVYAPDGRYTLPYVSLGRTFLSREGTELELDFLAATVRIKGFGLSALDDQINDGIAHEVRAHPVHNDFVLDSDTIISSIEVDAKK